MNTAEIIKSEYDKWEKVENTLTTHCNSFVSGVMNKLNYFAFDGRVANTIIDIMEFEKYKWQKIQVSDWNQLDLVIAGQKGEIHGHICILIAGEFIESGKWAKKVPLCANIGSDNFYGKGVNFVFRTEPIYYRFSA